MTKYYRFSLHREWVVEDNSENSGVDTVYDKVIAEFMNVDLADSVWVDELSKLEADQEMVDFDFIVEA